jgi:hypothetical protein
VLDDKSFGLLGYAGGAQCAAGFSKTLSTVNEEGVRVAKSGGPLFLLKNKCSHRFKSFCNILK